MNRLRWFVWSEIWLGKGNNGKWNEIGYQLARDAIAGGLQKQRKPGGCNKELEVLVPEFPLSLKPARDATGAYPKKQL